MQAIAPHRLELHFDIDSPVEITDLTLSFNGLARDYRKFLIDKIRSNGGKIKNAEVKLYVTKIESNCILAELAGGNSVMGAIVSVMDYQLIFTDYVAHVRNTINYLKGVGKKGTVDPKSVKMSKAQSKSYGDFLNVVAENGDGKFALRSLEYSDESQHRKVHARAEFSSDEALDARRGALIVSKALDYRGDADHREVLMYFHQTNLDDPKSTGATGDKAVVRSISDKPLPVHFISELDTEKIRDLKDDEDYNPLKLELRVDVNVEKGRNEEPRFYRVLNIHEIIREDDDNA